MAVSIDPHPGVDSASPQNWMEAARLLRPQGRHGELLAEPAADLELFVPGRQFSLGSNSASPDQPQARVELESAWQPTGRNAGRLVLKLRGTDTITAAEALAGKHLFVRTDELPPLEEGTYRVRDLSGCDLYDGDLLVGSVVDLQFAVAPDGRTRLPDAPDLLVVEPIKSRVNPADEPVDQNEQAVEPVLVPFVRAWLIEVDVAAKRLRMQLPPGLFSGDDE